MGLASRQIGMSQRQIVGIILVRNEDVQLHRVIKNILDFCDVLIIADHQSTDSTPQIIQKLVSESPKIQATTISHPRESHELIKKFAGTDRWIFGVDGDEIYDPVGLSRMRKRIFEGRYDDSWMILANVLNCDRIDPNSNIASGWLAPPCRSITKLYNFAHIRSWNGDTPERLHGGYIEFQPTRNADARFNLHEQESWDDSPLRCLHACFTPRSHLDGSRTIIRENIMDIHAASLLARLHRWWKMLRGLPLESAWKKSRYRRGPRVTVDVAPFFS